MKVKILATILAGVVLAGCGQVDKDILRVQKAKPWGSNQESYQEMLNKHGTEFCKDVLWAKTGNGDDAVVTATCVLGDPSKEVNGLIQKATNEEIQEARINNLMGEDSVEKIRQESDRLLARAPDKVTAELVMHIKDDLVVGDKASVTQWKDGKVVKVKSVDPSMILYNALIIDSGVKDRAFAREQFLTQDDSDLSYYKKKLWDAGNN